MYYGEVEQALTADWAGVAATFLAVLVALFKEQLQSLFFKPSFHIAIFSVKTQSLVYSAGTDGLKHLLWSGSIYWARLWVENVGNRRAEAVEVFVTKVERLKRDGTYAAVENFIPSNLRWANTNPEKPEVFCDVNPGMGRFCDFGSVADPACTTLQAIPGAEKGSDATFDLVLQVPLPMDAHRLVPGDYRIKLKISAANSRPIERTVKVSLSGIWTESADDMFSKQLGVSIAT